MQELSDYKPQPLESPMDIHRAGPSQETAFITSEQADAINEKVGRLRDAAVENAISRLPGIHGRAAELRVESGIDNRLVPYLRESVEITFQLDSAEHKAHLAEYEDFSNHCETGAVLCPDGREDPYGTFAGPGELKFDRRLAGLPDTRNSTSLPVVPVLDDPDMYANIKNAFDELAAKNKKAREEPDGKEFPLELVEFFGPHIISTHPSNGCSYLAGETMGVGHIPEIGMRMGGLMEYSKGLKGGFHAFNNNAVIAGGVGTTFFTIVDHYSQGLIVAPEDLASHLDSSHSLRQNLIDLHNNNTILMSENLDDSFYQQVLDLAGSLGLERTLNLRDYEQLVPNSIILGKIAMTIALEQERDHFPLIPDSLLKDATPTAARVLQYVIARNCTARILSDLKKGNHPLMKHPEQFLRVGSSGAENNVTNVPFIQRTPAGPIRQSDIEGAGKLYGILLSTLENQGVNMTEEGRIILVTGEFNETDYRTPEIAQKILTGVQSNVSNNAARFRRLFAPSVETGEAVIIGGVFDHTKKELVKIV